MCRDPFTIAIVDCRVYYLLVDRFYNCKLISLNGSTILQQEEKD